MKKRIHHDVYVGIFMAILTILGTLRTFTMPKGSDMFPQLLFALFGIFSISIIYKGIKESVVMTQEGRQDEITMKGLKLPFAALGIATVYTILVKYLGFFASTIIYIPAFMYFYRYKKVPIMVMSVAGTLVFIYLVFIKQLNVPFPAGILF